VQVSQARAPVGTPAVNSGARRHAALLFFLSLLFALRVAGQALQHWYPVQFLPPFAAWQGSKFPYPLLLLAQLLILTLMLGVCWRTALGNNRPNPRLARWLACFGAVYMTGSLARIVIGLTVSAAPAWFSAWISAVLHLVLAGFVLTAAHYHYYCHHAPADGPDDKTAIPAADAS
jgi:hypothetical protein